MRRRHSVRLMAVIAGSLSLVVLLAAAQAAFASVTFDPTCPYTPSNGTGRCGFVGKGDVQSALGYNNAKMQQNAGNLVFTYAQPATQALSQNGSQAATQNGSQAGSQAATQSGTQAGSQSVSETLSCDGTDGHHSFYREGTRTGTRDGSRDGSREGIRNGTRTGSRDGIRNGSRTGSVAGHVSYTIDYDARVKNQIDGFFLTGVNGTGFVASGAPVWSDWSFGDYSWGPYSWGTYSFGDYSWSDYSWGDYSWGDTTWGDWVSAPGENPNMCNSNNPGIANVSDEVTPVTTTDGTITDGVVIEGAVTDGAITDGTVTDGAITPGSISYGAVTPTGPAHLYVNGVAIN
jgi:hypothetical protein